MTGPGPRNIVILADGTGQRGGVRPDERRSNVYKLFRAARAGPDSTVDPALQVAVYDAGLGTLPGGIDSPAALARSLYNLAAQATGLGITGNIVDCYAAVIRHWRPGDRVFLFGFSRGAYTVRCLGGVLKLCGVPVTDAAGAPIRRDPATLRRLAREGVAVYTFTNSRPESERTPRQAELMRQRALLAARFRTRHRSHHPGIDGGNARPHFIGVFDTVASLGNPKAIAALFGIGLAAVAVVLAPATALAAHRAGARIGEWLGWLAIAIGGAALLVLLCLFARRIRVAFGLPGVPWWRTLHVATARMKMYDRELDPAVRYARQALSIDEDRASFALVPWGEPGQGQDGDPVRFEQYWFAGVHSDVGGSYPEDEARLSDVALDWMLGAARPAGLLHDPAVLRLWPDAAGMQHDERRSGLFRWFARRARRVPPEAPLHASVAERFRAGEVLHWDRCAPYRPDNLRGHGEVEGFYEAGR